MLARDWLKWCTVWSVERRMAERRGQLEVTVRRQAVDADAAADAAADADAAAAAAAAAAATAPRHGQPQVNLKRQQQTITCHKLGKLANKLGDMEHIKSTGSSFCRMLPR